VEPLRDVLAEILPVEVRRPAGSEADEVDQLRQTLAVVARREIDADLALGRVAQQVALQQCGLEDEGLDRASRGLAVAAHGEILLCLGCPLSMAFGLLVQQPGMGGTRRWRNSRLSPAGLLARLAPGSNRRA